MLVGERALFGAAGVGLLGGRRAAVRLRDQLDAILRVGTGADLAIMSA